eukprot:TRINITY_DN17182_c0_g1_i7.p1 TRINITY_DN17182_c0_g1~~TRINITY_DN17182_c0_g1_i7.p1  ORF type:complete len:103 (+),score=11.64 TRINITY_DN17182_c0_g1_i7:321-629(+)
MRRIFTVACAYTPGPPLHTPLRSPHLPPHPLRTPLPASSSIPASTSPAPASSSREILKTNVHHREQASRSTNEFCRKEYSFDLLTPSEHHYVPPEVGDPAQE